LRLGLLGTFDATLPASLESQGSAPASPVQRDKGPLDLCFLFRLTPVPRLFFNAWGQRPNALLFRAVLSSTIHVSLRTPRLAFLRFAILASLESPGFAIHGEPARREKGSPDLSLLPPRPWQARSGEPRFNKSQTVRLTPIVLILVPHKRRARHKGGLCVCAWLGD
jgi:hypothetical protein